MPIPLSIGGWRVIYFLIIKQASFLKSISYTNFIAYGNQKKSRIA
jgi:hypothetical protein